MSSLDVSELNVCRTQWCRTFGTEDRSIVKTYDYINRFVITLPLTVYEGTYMTLSPLVAMHLIDRSCVSVGIFLKLHATFSNNHDYANKIARKKIDLMRKRRTKKMVNKTAIFCEVGEMKTRGKWQIM